MNRELEIWGVAKLLISQHGDQARAEAIRMGERLRGMPDPDPDGIAFWAAVETAACELQRTSGTLN